MQAAAELSEWMDGFLREQEASDAFSGSMAIERGDRIEFQGAYGQAHKGFGVPNQIDTRFNLASIAKMFTAVAVLQLYEQGKLALDASVSAYLPELKVGGIDRITIHHLLCHQSGLGDYWNERCKQRRSTLRTIAAYLELIEGMQPAFEPGSSAAYGNAGYLVLGAIIEKVAQTDFYEYVEQHVCRPADMSRTAFLHLDHVADFAHGYTHIEWEGPAHPDYRTDNLFQYPVRGNPAGGLYSTAPDMIRFGAALRDGRLLREDSRRRMLSLHVRGAHGVHLGYGCQHVPYSQGSAVGHGGRAFGAATMFLFLPEVDYRVCILSNYDRPADKRVFQRFDDWLAGRVDQATPRASST